MEANINHKQKLLYKLEKSLYERKQKSEEMSHLNENHFVQNPDESLENLNYKGR